MVGNILGAFPSTGGADLIVGCGLNPGRIGVMWVETLTKFGGPVVFLLVSFWAGAKLADRAYSLESQSFSGSTAKPDRRFYKTIYNLGGGRSFGRLLVSVFKDYGRRLENISKIVYIVGLIVLILVFLTAPLEEGGPFELLIIVQFIFAMLAAMVVGDVTVRGKEALFIYRKAPDGVNRLVRARLVHGWIIVIPVVAGIVMFLLASAPDSTWQTILGYTGIEVLIVTGLVAFALGIALINPAYTEKESMANAVIVSMVSMFSFIFIMIFIGGELKALLVMIVFTWMLGLAFLSLGKRKLNNIE
jgi:hypothetical protein